MEKGQIELGKFSLLSVIVILFRDNQKNIRVGLSGRNNADFLFVYKKIRAISGLSGRHRLLVTHGCFPKRPAIFEIYVKISAF